MEKTVIKVGSCTPSGDLLMEKSVIIERYEFAYDEILAMPEGLESFRKILSLADFCYKHGLDYKAYNLYSKVFRSFSWYCQGEERILFDEAIQGLSALCSSKDECVWEMCSQIVGDYMMWKQEQDEKNMDRI
ncbi:MAG: hypothetical protein IKU98_08020 [Bacteroidaceae bacterium]|nr:hypothetical protein [Bacteroidaceae bacterium]